MEDSMLKWALGFLVFALVAGFMGYGSVASTSLSIARVLFVVFLIFFFVALVMSLLTRRSSSIP